MARLYHLALLVAFLALLAGGGLLLVRSARPPGVEILLPTLTPTPQWKVYITGAVVSPGVYRVQPDDRLEIVLQAAGGPTEDADLDRVNLALRVRDQAHYSIPRKGEPLASVSPSNSGKMNLNTASLEELKTLPGIGPVRARAIVSYREEQGPFRSVEELLRVQGIGHAILAQFRDLVAVEGSSP